MIPNRRRNEVLENLIASGGGSSDGGSSDTQHIKRFPSSFNHVIQYMLEIHYKLQDMVENDIPRAFPSTEPKVRQDPRYNHDSAETFYARPVTVIKDANTALEVCARIKEYANITKTLFDNFFPKRIENSAFLTEVRDGFQADIELINSFLENVEKIQNLLLRSKMSSLTTTVDINEIEKLRCHLIKIGYDTNKNNKSLIEIFPNVLTMRDNDGNLNINVHDTRSLHDTSVLNDEDDEEELTCKLSDRLIQDFSRER